jgi:uncharacterized protein YndB with AHSA1/START domain
MPDIYHDFPINADAARVFDAISTAAGLDRWWTKRSVGQPEVGVEYQLDFGPEHRWRALVSRCEPGRAFELQMTMSDPDWNGSKVGFELEPTRDGTQVRFSHLGLPESNEHYRISTYCWAMYLRVLKRHLEFGEEVEYERRLEV